MTRKFRPRFLFIIPLVLLGIAAFGLIIMLLWNNVLAVVLHLSTITFWQGLGIFVLAKILFGGFGPGGYRGGRMRRRFQEKFNQRFQEKWATMTPEEKEKYKERWRMGRCGYGPWDWEETAGSQQPTVNSQSS